MSLGTILKDSFYCCSQKSKRKQTKPKGKRRKEIIKIRAEINETDMKKMIAKINENKS